MADTMRSDGSPLSPDMFHLGQKRKESLIARWNRLTAIPEPSPAAHFVAREAARKSQMTSNVLFFFTVMVVCLLPACYITPYPIYFWLDLGLTLSCVLALALNRYGFTFLAGLLVILAGFVALTLALFSTLPFDETTLQGYDMYVIVELLAVSLLPVRSVFVVFVGSVGAILYTLFYMPHTPVLAADLHSRLPLILARPIGTLFLVAGVAFILSTMLTNAIRRAGQAEMIAKLEHEMYEQKQALEEGVQQILQTHVEISNGNLNARAPLSQNNILWQIARALNNLLVRYQRAAQAEQELQRVDRAVAAYVHSIQHAEQRHQVPVLPLHQTRIDPLIAALQDKKIGHVHVMREIARPSQEFPPYW